MSMSLLQEKNANEKAFFEENARVDKTDDPDLPKPMVILTPNIHRTSNKARSLRRFPRSSCPPSLIPPLTPRAWGGTWKTRWATPSPPGRIMYSGELKEMAARESESSSGGGLDGPSVELVGDR